MKSTTFHYLAQAARDHIDFEELGIPVDTTPLEHFVRTQSLPTKKQIKHLTKVYEDQDLRVKVPRHGPEPLTFRDAVLAMGDQPEVTVKRKNSGTSGRPARSSLVDLSALKLLIMKYGHRIRDLAEMCELYPSAVSMLLRGPQKITPERLERVLSSAQMLLTGNDPALRELRALEKEL